VAVHTAHGLFIATGNGHCYSTVPGLAVVVVALIRRLVSVDSVSQQDKVRALQPMLYQKYGAAF
jgi:hypothetical protein